MKHKNRAWENSDPPGIPQAHTPIKEGQYIGYILKER